MPHNRISHWNRIAAYQPVAEFSTASTAASAGASTSMVYVPLMAPQAVWQAQLYKLAYEKAAADLAPPRHYRRFFSIWN